jgi:prefoldin subunit 5
MIYDDLVDKVMEIGELVNDRDDLMSQIEKLKKEVLRLEDDNQSLRQTLKYITNQYQNSRKYLESIKALAVVKGNSQDFFDIAEKALR